jgi:uncharacterized membrane protein (UPF0127 family)
MKRNLMVQFLFSLILGLGLMVSSPPSFAADNIAGKFVVVVDTASGPKSFGVEVAEDEASREQGMMFRTGLKPDRGMLFDFHTPQPVTFWMKNCLISLDMIFIRADGVIANIHANAKPGDTTLLPSDGPILGVLEIGGGLSAKLGIRPGDKVRHPMFK